VVFIASNVRRIALHEKNNGRSFDANVFIDSFQQALPDGTIIIPAYTDLLKSGDTFDIEKSVPTSGALSRKVLKRHDFVRTDDPLHSVMVWGKKSSEVLALEDKSTFGTDSIFGFLHREKAKMLFIDVEFEESFTFIHYVEEILDVDYRKYFNITINRKLKDKSDAKEIRFHTKKKGIITQLKKLETDMKHEGILTSFPINEIDINKLNLDIAYTRIKKEIEFNGGKDLHRFDMAMYLKQLVKSILGKR